METRAHFILIGAFTLAALLGTLGFFIWLASVQIDRQYATYGILFDNVSGLDRSGDVLFNGISVGKVIGLEIYPQDPSKVFTTVEIDANTPIRTNTVAQLQSQGVTGVSYIALSGGTADALALRSEDGGLPIIRSEQSTLQALVEGAPDLLEQASGLLAQLQALTGPENQASVTAILTNLETSSQRLDQALTDFSAITTTVAEATAQITRFTNRLDSIGETVETTLNSADDTLVSAKKAFESADAALIGSAQAITNAEAAFAQAQDLLRTQLPDILDRVAGAVTNANTAITDLQGRSATALDGFGQTAALLNDRLVQIETTLSGADTAFTAVTSASDSFAALVDGDGAALVADSRAVLADAKTAIAALGSVVDTDVPAIVADIRTAVATASAAVDKVAADVTGLTARLDPLADSTQQAVTTANDLLVRAQSSLTTLDTTLVGAQSALASADGAFAAATGVMETDLGPVLDDLRLAANRIGTAVEDVTRDVPEIAADLRDLVARTDAVVAQVQAAVAAAAPGITDFANSGLSELKRLGSETRGLVTTLDALVRRINSDPARFLLDSRVPEYRR